MGEVSSFDLSAGFLILTHLDSVLSHTNIYTLWIETVLIESQNLDSEEQKNSIVNKNRKKFVESKN